MSSAVCLDEHEILIRKSWKNKFELTILDKRGVNKFQTVKKEIYIQIKFIYSNVLLNFVQNFII